MVGKVLSRVDPWQTKFTNICQEIHNISHQSKQKGKHVLNNEVPKIDYRDKTVSLDTHEGNVKDGFYSDYSTPLDAESGCSSDTPEHYDMLEPNGSNTVSGYLLSGPFPAISCPDPSLSTPVGSCQLPSTPGNSSRSFIHFPCLLYLGLVLCTPTFSNIFRCFSFLGLTYNSCSSDPDFVAFLLNLQSGVFL